MKSYCKGLKIDATFIEEAIDRWSMSESGHDNYWRINKEYGARSNLTLEILREIKTRSLYFNPINYGTRREAGNKKERFIGQESVKQQIVNYIAIMAMEEFLNARIGFYQVGSIPGKGPVFAKNTVENWAIEHGYWVHLDVRKCYQSIRHADIMNILRKYIRSDDVLYICQSLLDTYEKGLNIGSYFSLKMSQLIMSFGYHRMEDLHMTRRGKRIPLIAHQIWYADDIYLFSPNKKNLRRAVLNLQGYMMYHFKLNFHDWKISEIGRDEPIAIVGYKCAPECTTLKSDLYLRIRRAYLRFDKHPTLHGARSVCSYWGYLKHSNSYEVTQKYGFDRIFKKARTYVSRYEKERRFKHACRNSIIRTDREDLEGVS